ncbi:signal peptidase I [Metabacillus sp. KIGAM252]|uniref:Signal peptidase I n=1 Tax=Metabacillus flavus TaxID=2823519 RepID=A0ABS5LJ42_9BACI|nr:signal peptidase I [Metabacillus flavus]MBS2970771.1 signal peptidase I [Metabacillus flavus]
MNNKMAETPINKSPNSLRGWILFILAMAFIIFVYRCTIGIQLISGNSMNPTIQDRNAVLISKLFFNPDKGDIVIARDPHGYNIIKRVIAVSNDTVSIKDGITYVNGKALVEPYTSGTSEDLEEIKVPENRYFIAGDNRTLGESLDSRDPSVGMIPKENLIGEVLVSLLPSKIL